MILEAIEEKNFTDIFLDTKHRLYSCAYWKENTKTLEEAQQNKN
jgi:cyclopropane fatty-acyl-phospholipid synthase-like methyltransferase